MVVLSNHRLGPSTELLLVSDDVARMMLKATAEAARPFAEARWELELVRGLEAWADRCPDIIDVGDIAWTPDHFEPQRRFLVSAISRAAATLPYTVAFDRWRLLIEAHPANSVQVGRRWQRQPTA